MADYKVFMNGWKKAKKRIGETKMHKYKVALTIGNILTITYTVKAFSYKHALYKAKFRAFVYMVILRLQEHMLKK